MPSDIRVFLGTVAVSVISCILFVVLLAQI
jgi:hypothetical protein